MGGFNSEVSHGEKSYHVQSEDKGTGAYYVETIVFCSGRVIFTRKSPYTHLLSLTDRADRIQNFVAEQHASMIADIRAGKFDHL